MEISLGFSFHASWLTGRPPSASARPLPGPRTGRSPFSRLAATVACLGHPSKDNNHRATKPHRITHELIVRLPVSTVPLNASPRFVGRTKLSSQQEAGPSPTAKRGKSDCRRPIEPRAAGGLKLTTVPTHHGGHPSGCQRRHDWPD